MPMSKSKHPADIARVVLIFKGFTGDKVSTGKVSIGGVLTSKDVVLDAHSIGTSTCGIVG